MVIITGKLIKELREKNGISQQKLANMISISQAHIAKIENEKVNPTLSTVNKIMSILKEDNKVKCKKIMKKSIIHVNPNDRISVVVKLMKNFQISQIPVIDKDICIGSITEKSIINNMNRKINKLRVKDIMDRPFPIISSQEDAEMAKILLEYTNAVLVSENQKIVGIITKSDIMNMMK